MNRLRRALIAIVSSLFASSLALSLSALYAAGSEAEISIPLLWPWIVDGFILAMTLVIVEARRSGRAASTFWPRAGMYSVAAVSAVIQAHYAPADPWTKLLHMLAPVAVLWSFEVLMWLLYGELARPARVGAQPAAVPAQATTEQPQAQTVSAPDKPTPARKTAAAAVPTRRGQGDLTQARLARVWRATPPPSGGWTDTRLARAASEAHPGTPVSRSSARRFLERQARQAHQRDARQAHG